VNATQSTNYWENGTTSREIEVAELERGIDFALPGDSSAMVISLKKEWVGVLHGRLLKGSLGLIQELMDDIKAKTGGSISLV
jgi:hypothetical protein